MDRDRLLELLRDAPRGPCVTIHMPTHRRFPEKRQDPVRFRNLVGRAEAVLREHAPQRDPAPLLDPLRALEADAGFWRHGAEGLAVFVDADGSLRTLRLPRALPERVAVGDAFLVRPLLRALDDAGRFQVLCLTRREVRLLEGDRDGLDEVELAPEVPATIERTIASTDGTPPDPGAQPGPPVASAGGQRGRGGTRTGTIDHRHGAATDAVDPDVEIFFRTVDRTVFEHHSRPTGLPLVVVGVADNLGPFRALSRNPCRLDPGVEADPSALDAERLCALAWPLVRDREEARIAETLDRWGAARTHGLATDTIGQASAAAADGRVETLLVEAPPAPAEGAAPSGDAFRTADDDAIDALGEQVLRTGGELRVLPPGRLGGAVRAAAILRW